MSQDAIHKEEIRYVRLDNLTIGSHVREQPPDDSLKGLARTFQEVGIQNPPRVNRKGQVIVGARRVRAARMLNWTEIPVIVEEKELCEAEVLQRQLIENCQREGLKPTEKARGIERWIETSGAPAARVAGMLGLSAGSMPKSLSILGLPEWIKKHLDDGAIAESAAYDLSRVDDPEKQAAFARRLVDGELTRDGLVGELKAERSGKAKKGCAKSGRVTAVLGGGQSVTVSGSGLTLERFIEVIETVLAKARRVRTSGAELKEFIRTLRNESKADIPVASEKEVAHVAV